jgi:hypothetical protein
MDPVEEIEDWCLCRFADLRPVLDCKGKGFGDEEGVSRKGLAPFRYRSVKVSDEAPSP